METTETPTQPTYIVPAFGGQSIGDTVAIWESHNLNSGNRHHYINQPAEDLDPAAQRVTTYGVRGSGQGEDNVNHSFIGMARIVKPARMWAPFYHCDWEPEFGCPPETCPGHASVHSWAVQMVGDSVNA